MPDPKRRRELRGTRDGGTSRGPSGSEGTTGESNRDSTASKRLLGRSDDGPVRGEFSGETPALSEHDAPWQGAPRDPARADDLRASVHPGQRAMEEEERLRADPNSDYYRSGER